MVTECEFITVYNAYYQKIIQYLTRMVGPNDAEDLAQEVFDKISRNLGGFKGESKLSTWIYRIATNTAIDRLRSAGYKQTMESIPLEDNFGFDGRSACSSSGSPAADQAVIHREMNGCIAEYINNLPSNYRTVLVLSELKGLSNREIADVLKISLENAKVRLHRARGKLKEVLNNGCVFYHNEKNALACDRKPIPILPKVST